MSRILWYLLFAAGVHAAEFYTGQAARAVIGQSSFSSREARMSPSAIVVSNGRLYVADRENQVLTFDLTKLPGPRDQIGRSSRLCPVCLLTPLATAQQSVLPGSSTVSAYGKTIAEIDTRRNRVLLWRDATSPSALSGPDVILGPSDAGDSNISEFSIVEPVSVAVDGQRLYVGDGKLHRVLVWNTLPTTTNTPPDAVLGQPDFFSKALADSRRADTISRPDALASDGTNLFVGDSVDHRILVFTAADSTLPSSAVVNSATLSAEALASGTLITIAGGKFSDSPAVAQDDGTEALPDNLAGVEVVFDGAPLPLLSVSSTEVRAQLPYTAKGATAGSLYVRSEHSDGTVEITSAASIKLASASPGLFAFPGREPRTGILLHSRNTGIQDGTPVTSDTPARPGEIVTVWATGLRVPSDQDLVAGVPNHASALPLNGVAA
ncbi:MAG: IPT/TIG domain-containing protein, partial [Acidobacteriaceae bacterium]|nr:IPT/TIG domain-containing protein [Acidobacteriaceae bacterium]